LVSADAIEQFRETVEGLLGPMPEWAFVAVLVAGVLIGFAAIHLLIGVLAHRLVTRINGDTDDAVFAAVQRPLDATILYGGIVVLFDVVPDLFSFSGTIELFGLSALIIWWSVALRRAFRLATESMVSTRYFDEDFLPIFRNLMSIIIVFVGVSALLAVWGVDVTPLLASAGIVGIAVGFAAKDAVANLFGSLALYSDETYRKGDYIILDSGLEGTVIDVGLRSTNIITRDDVRVTVPNSTLNTATIVNASAPKTNRRMKVPVTVSYDSDVEHVREVLLDIATDNETVAKRPSPIARLDALGESALEFTLLCWVDEPRADAGARDELNTAIVKEFAANDISIPFPQRDIHLDSPDRTNTDVP
jgi:small-conductance mechanosensitive channel